MVSKVVDSEDGKVSGYLGWWTNVGQDKCEQQHRCNQNMKRYFRLCGSLHIHVHVSLCNPKRCSVVSDQSLLYSRVLFLFCSSLNKVQF